MFDQLLTSGQVVTITTMPEGQSVHVLHGIGGIKIEESNGQGGWVKIHENRIARNVTLAVTNATWRVTNYGVVSIAVSIETVESAGTVDNAAVNAAIAEDVTATRNALGLAETSSAYTDFNVTMEPLFSGSRVQEGEFTPPANWEDILIVTQVDITYVSAGAIIAALQIKTTTGGHVVPWAIPVESSGVWAGNEMADPRLTVIRLQRAGAAVMLNVYMANSSYQWGQFMNEMNSFYQPTSFADYNLGDGSGGGYGGYGGGGDVPIEELIGLHWQSQSVTRVDGRAISACVFHEYSPGGIGDFLLRLHTTQYGSVENLNVRILAR